MVDEKLWNEESDEEEDGDDNEEEKFEKGKAVSGEDTGEVCELRRLRPQLPEQVLNLAVTLPCADPWQGRGPG